MQKILLYILWLVPINSLAQNLVPNPGFELFYDCPDGLRQLKKTKKWYAGNTGTPEYFRTDCEYVNGQPNSGIGYVGLILFCGYPDAIEYIGVELLDTLKLNSKYCASFHIRAADSCYTYIDQVGMLFTQHKEYLNMFAPIIKKPQIQSKYSKPIVPDLGWLKVSSEFIANGKEKFLTIGNFIEPDRHVKVINEFADHPGPGWNSYYLIDDVSVKEIEKNESCESVGNEFQAISDKPSRDTVKLQNVFYFESDQFELDSVELRRLVQWKIELRNYSIIQTVVASNTDSDAGVSYNYLLSEKRAEYVLSILSSVLNNNIQVSNHGETKPVATNDSEIGKRNNRNVQISLVGFDK